LAPADKAHLRDLLDDDLADYVSPQFTQLLQERWADAVAHPDSCVSIDEDMRELRARRAHP
jgi:hypothetical protein